MPTDRRTHDDTELRRLCLMLYVTIDDHYRALPAALKPRGEQAACSDSELLTMLVVSECLGWQRETEHVSQWARHRDLFPHQPDRTRLNRRRRALTTTLIALRCRVLAARIPAQTGSASWTRSPCR